MRAAAEAEAKTEQQQQQQQQLMLRLQKKRPEAAAAKTEAAERQKKIDEANWAARKAAKLARRRRGRRPAYGDDLVSSE